MTGAIDRGHREAVDIVDAEFETVSSASVGPMPSPARETRGATVLQGQPPTRHSRFRPGGAAFWIGGLLAIGGAFWLSGGHALLAALPDTQQTALRVAHFTSRVETGANGPLLMVDGELANDGRADAAVPPFAIDITTEDGATMRYFIAEGDRIVRARGVYRFSSKLAVPARRIERVTVRLEAAGSGVGI